MLAQQFANAEMYGTKYQDACYIQDSERLTHRASAFIRQATRVIPITFTTRINTFESSKTA